MPRRIALSERAPTRHPPRTLSLGPSAVRRPMVLKYAQSAAQLRKGKTSRLSAWCPDSAITTGAEARARLGGWWT